MHCFPDRSEELLFSRGMYRQALEKKTFKLLIAVRHLLWPHRQRSSPPPPKKKTREMSGSIDIAFSLLELCGILSAIVGNLYRKGREKTSIKSLFISLIV